MAVRRRRRFIVALPSGSATRGGSRVRCRAAWQRLHHPDELAGAQLPYRPRADFRERRQAPLERRRSASHRRVRRGFRGRERSSCGQRTLRRTAKNPHQVLERRSRHADRRVRTLVHDDARRHARHREHDDPVSLYLADDAARHVQRVPVSVAYRKGTPLDGSAPLFQYGYGSYGYSTDPTFRSNWVSLLERGFVVAIAHVRGGQELGRSWYEDGRLRHKLNTFTDFIDVTRFLVQHGY